MRTKSFKHLIVSLGILAFISLLASCSTDTSNPPRSYDTSIRYFATHTAFAATAIAQGTPQPAVSSPTVDPIFFMTQEQVDEQLAGYNGSWYISFDTAARINATNTAFVATAVAQGTSQASISVPLVDYSFYLTRVAADTQSAPVINASLTAFQVQVWTAVAQGTPFSELQTPEADILLVQLQQTEFAKTAVAQGTSAASLPTFTPIPTLDDTPTPIPTATTYVALPNVPTDWYADPLTGPLLAPIRSLGGEDLVNKLVIALLSALGAAFLFSFKSIMRGIYSLGVRIWNLYRGLNRDYVFERAYLDWIVGQYRHLGILPAQVAVRRWGERQQLVDLEQIYTRLALSNLADDEAWNSQTNQRTRWTNILPPALRLLKGFLRSVSTFMLNIYEAFRSILRRILSIQFTEANYSFQWLEEFLPEPKYIPGSLSLIIDRTYRLVIKGDPGSGKTTLMRYLAITCARGLRNDREEGDSNRIVLDRLSWGTKPYPIMVRLNRHADVVNWGDKKGMVDVFRDELPIDLRRLCPEGYFERLLRKKSCLILLDAFDELGSAQARSAMTDYINGFLGIFGKEKHRIIVTTRIVGYEGQLDRSGFQSRMVQPLQQEDRKSLISLRYQAFTLVEKLGRTPSEERSIEWHLEQRKQTLIKRIEATPRLLQLATNPMLLSLITLVHFLKVELPDERVLLYRDCVEILTERWQRYKREEAGQSAYPAQDLTLSQKTIILQELAFAMQHRRDSSSSQALIPKRAAIPIITDILNRFSGDTHGKDETNRRAEEWVMGIQSDSGIVLEQGLDPDGEPLIGFSHLTFQEYLTAVAINEKPAYLDDLMRNLLNPAWREVVRLYVVLADDATSIIKALSTVDDQPAGYILAGWCITEKLKRADPSIIQTVKDNLISTFLMDDSPLNEISEIMEKALQTLNIIPFLLEQISSQNLDRQIAAIYALRGISSNNLQLSQIKSSLISIIDSHPSIKTRIAAQETLLHIGDPRFESYTPVTVKIPAYLLKDVISSILQLPAVWEKATRAPLIRFAAYFHAWFIAYNMRSTPEARFFSQKLYILWRKFILRSNYYTDEFEMARFPVTNMEYARFIDETGHLAPVWWGGYRYPLERALHPVTGISRKSAERYCEWLTEKTGEIYYLPSEWEWEAATGVLDGFKYPWGSEFEENKCNSEESELKETTPVGIYYDVRSVHGVQDSSGNVWEFAVSPKNIYVGPLSYFYLIITLISFLVTGNFTKAILVFLLPLTLLISVTPLGAQIIFSFLYSSGLLKGGSFLSNRDMVHSDVRWLGPQFGAADVGFRVAREINKNLKS